MTTDPAPPNRGWRFDPVISLGNILQAIVLVGGLAGIWTMNEVRAAQFDARLASTEEQVKALNMSTATLITLTADNRNMQAQLNRLQVEIDRLRP